MGCSNTTIKKLHEFFDHAGMTAKCTTRTYSVGFNFAGTFSIAAIDARTVYAAQLTKKSSRPVALRPSSGPIQTTTNVDHQLGKLRAYPRHLRIPGVTRVATGRWEESCP